MPVPGLQSEKCAQRNRLAAKRAGIEATPMRFVKQATTVGQGSSHALGTLPSNDEEALARINAMRGEDAEPLTLDQVYIHYAEAANSNFIADRYAFLSTKTLKNIARDAQSGFAFMNSHRTGGLSHPSELPFGRTFAGRYEKTDDGSERTLIGFYMLRGQYPNGQSGPSTDDLHAGIEGGTIFDVSVGLYGGQAICDVCGGDVSAYASCPHVPGTDYDMTMEEMEAQKARGVPDGFASYTIEDARCGETSAVFDGAVPGAGFKKALTLAKSGKLNAAQVLQARSAYAALTAKGDLNMDGLVEAISGAFSAVLERFGLKPTTDFSPADSETTPAAEETIAETDAEPADETPEPQSDPQTEPTPAEAEVDPVLQAARAAGVADAAWFTELSALAQIGQAHLAARREEAVKLAVVAFGADTDAARAQLAAAKTFLASAPIEQVEMLATQYRAVAVKMGLQTEDGTPGKRLSAPAPTQNFAKDVADPQAPAQADGVVILEPASASYARRKREAEEYASGKRR